MTKLCSVCGTENREEAQFCRACGTAFAAPASRGATSDGAAAVSVCAECGFQNKPGLRYCANCGVSLAAAAPDAVGVGEASGGIGPPAISYPSFATVRPYPPAPPSTVPEIPDADAEIALRQQEASESGSPTLPFDNAPSRSRAPLVIGIVALVLVVGGALAWTFMRDSNPAPPAIGVTAPPVAATLPATSAALPPVTVEATPASPAAAAATSAAAAETPPAAATAAPLDTPPAAAPPLPHVGDAVPAPSPAEVEAKRLAAEKRRERAAREKADREAKAVAEQRDQKAAAAQRAEQDAAARRRAEEAQRARAAAAAPPPAPAVAQARGVREICSGRNAIAEAICQSRQCGQAEHAVEAICRQLREQEERRRNMQP